MTTRLTRVLLFAAATAATLTLSAAAYAQDDSSDPLHGCTSSSCSDNGQFTPITPGSGGSLTDFGWSSSPAGATGDLSIIVLVPTGDAFDTTITGTGLSGATDFTQMAGATGSPDAGGDVFNLGTLQQFLGISANPNNPIGSFTVGVDSSVKGFDVYEVNVPETLTLNGPSDTLADLFSIGGGVPNGAELVAFLAEAGGTTIATAPSGTLQDDPLAAPLPSSIWLLGSVLAGLFWLTRKRRNRAIPVSAFA